MTSLKYSPHLTRIRSNEEKKDFKMKEQEIIIETYFRQVKIEFDSNGSRNVKLGLLK